MSILEELNVMFGGLGVSVETGIFFDIAPNEYVVVTPMVDAFPFFTDDLIEYDQQEARLSIFCDENYLALKSKIIGALLTADFTITARQYIGHRDDTKHHHYAIDVAKIYHK